MAQLTYASNPAVAYEGQLADFGHRDIISKINSTNQLYLVTAVNAVNGAAYQININDGVNAAANALYTADGSATKTEIVNGLIAAIAALGLNVKTSVISLTGGTFYIEASGESAAASLLLVSNGDTPSDITFSQKVVQGQEVPFGRVVVWDEQRGDRYCRLPRVSGDIGNLSFGIAIQNSARQPNAGGYPHASVVPVLNKGRVWMRTEQDVLMGAAVYVRYTDGGAGKAVGQVRGDSDTSTAGALTRAVFKSSATAGNLVLVELS